MRKGVCGCWSLLLHSFRTSSDQVRRRRQIIPLVSWSASRTSPPKVHNIRSDMLHDDVSKQSSPVAILSLYVATLSHTLPHCLNVLRLQFWSPRPPTWRQWWSRQPVLGSSFGRLGGWQLDRRCWFNLRLHGLDLQVGGVEGQQGGSDVLHQLVLVHRLHLVQVEHLC